MCMEKMNGREQENIKLQEMGKVSFQICIFKYSLDYFRCLSELTQKEKLPF